MLLSCSGNTGPNSATLHQRTNRNRVSAQAPPAERTRSPACRLRSESQQHSRVDGVMYCFPVIPLLGFPAQPMPEPAVIAALNPKREASQTLHLNSGKTEDSTPNSAQCRLQTAALPPGRAQLPRPLHGHLLVHRKRPGQAARVHACVCTLHCLLLTGNTAQREGTRGRLRGIPHFS